MSSSGIHLILWTKGPHTLCCSKHSAMVCGLLFTFPNLVSPDLSRIAVHFGLHVNDFPVAVGRPSHSCDGSTYAEPRKLLHNVKHCRVFCVWKHGGQGEKENKRVKTIEHSNGFGPCNPLKTFLEETFRPLTFLSVIHRHDCAVGPCVAPAGRRLQTLILVLWVLSLPLFHLISSSAKLIGCLGLVLIITE